MDPNYKSETRALQMAIRSIARSISPLVPYTQDYHDKENITANLIVPYSLGQLTGFRFSCARDLFCELVIGADDVSFIMAVCCQKFVHKDCSKKK